MHQRKCHPTRNLGKFPNLIPQTSRNTNTNIKHLIHPKIKQLSLNRCTILGINPQLLYWSELYHVVRRGRILKKSHKQIIFTLKRLGNEGLSWQERRSGMFHSGLFSLLSSQTSVEGPCDGRKSRNNLLAAMVSESRQRAQSKLGGGRGPHQARCLHCVIES